MIFKKARNRAKKREWQEKKESKRLKIRRGYRDEIRNEYA